MVYGVTQLNKNPPYHQVTIITLKITVKPRPRSWNSLPRHWQSCSKAPNEIQLSLTFEWVCTHQPRHKDDISTQLQIWWSFLGILRVPYAIKETQVDPMAFPSFQHLSEPSTVGLIRLRPFENCSSKWSDQKRELIRALLSNRATQKRQDSQSFSAL